MIYEETKEKRLEELYYNNLGMCGCGRPDDIKQMLITIFEAEIECRENSRNIGFKELTESMNYPIKREKMMGSFDKELALEFMLHVLDHAGFMEHGSSIGGAWMTDLGKEFLDLLKEEQSEFDVQEYIKHNPQ